jgi:hypothetical protein
MCRTYGLRDVSTILVPLALGCIGWFATQYFANPLVRFVEIKRTAHELLFYTANVFGRDDPRLEKAVDDLRKVAAQISAFDATLPAWLRWLFFRRGYNLKEAVQRFTGLSNLLAAAPSGSGTSEATDTYNEKRLERYEIEKALKLPLTDEPKLIEALKNRVER